MTDATHSAVSPAVMLTEPSHIKKPFAAPMQFFPTEVTSTVPPVTERVPLE